MVYDGMLSDGLCFNLLMNKTTHMTVKTHVKETTDGCLQSVWQSNTQKNEFRLIFGKIFTLD